MEMAGVVDPAHTFGEELARSDAVVLAADGTEEHPDHD